MNPAEMQAAAAAVMSRLQGGGQGGGAPVNPQMNRVNPAMGQQGGYGPMNRVTSMIPPVMPGQRIEEDMPQWDARSMGNKIGGPPTPDNGGGAPLDFGAIMRRLIGNMSGPPGGAGSIPGGDTTARPVPGDHIGLSELGQGSLLDQIVKSLQASRGPQAPPPPMVGMR